MRRAVILAVQTTLNELRKRDRITMRLKCLCLIVVRVIYKCVYSKFEIALFALLYLNHRIYIRPQIGCFRMRIENESPIITALARNL